MKERLILNPHKNCKEATRKIVVKNLASGKSATFGFVCDKELRPIKSRKLLTLFPSHQSCSFQKTLVTHTPTPMFMSMCFCCFCTLANSKIESQSMYYYLTSGDFCTQFFIKNTPFFSFITRLWINS